MCPELNDLEDDTKIQQILHFVLAEVKTDGTFERLCTVSSETRVIKLFSGSKNSTTCLLLHTKKQDQSLTVPTQTWPYDGLSLGNPFTSDSLHITSASTLDIQDPEDPEHRPLSCINFDSSYDSCCSLSDPESTSELADTMEDNLATYRKHHPPSSRSARYVTPRAAKLYLEGYYHKLRLRVAEEQTKMDSKGKTKKSKKRSYSFNLGGKKKEGSKVSVEEAGPSEHHQGEERVQSSHRIKRWSFRIKKSKSFNHTK